MIVTSAKSLASSILTRSVRRSFAQDWSHIYNGIYQFEDPTLGEDALAIREQALTFAKTKLSPFSAEWEKNHTWPVETFK